MSEVELPPIYDDAELDEIPDPDPVIEGIIDQGKVVYLVAEWGKGKSFLVLDWAAHIANGMDWFGHETTKTRVLYVVGEGVTGMKRRAAAWRKEHGGKTGVHYMAGPVQIPSFDEMRELSDVIQEENYGLVIFDTQHVCTQGMIENDESDMGRVIGALRELIQDNPDLTVLVVHHMGKDPSRGARGSSAISGDTDDVYEILSSDPHALMTLKVAKRKDGEPIQPMKLRIRQVKLPGGKSSCVIEEAEGSEGTLEMVRGIWKESGAMSIQKLHQAAKDAGYTGNRETLTMELDDLAERGEIQLTIGSRRSRIYSEIMDVA